MSTSILSNIAQTTAVCGGNVADDGGSAILARGICWATHPNPTRDDYFTTDGSGTGDFTSLLSGLLPVENYYVRAYATNGMGTMYGEQFNFNTMQSVNGGLRCEGGLTVADVEGNVYNTVQLGTQCWMMENLRTTMYADGTPIALGNMNSQTIPYRYCPNEQASTVPIYGYLYNWKAVMRNESSSAATPSGVQGVCPDGWHVPSDAEWKEMELAAGMDPDLVEEEEYRGAIAARLCGNTGWTPSTVENSAGDLSAVERNLSGFSALPAGYRLPLLPYYRCFASGSFFWTSTLYHMNPYVYSRGMGYLSGDVCRCAYEKEIGCSVRCLRN